jgi:glycosyltransferase involved in cell wall biosynthesis
MSNATQFSTRGCVETPPRLFRIEKLRLSKQRLLLVMNDDRYFLCHRLDLARAARSAGMEVLVVTHADDKGKRILDEGFQYLPIPFIKGGRQPLRELAAIMKLAQLYRREKPDIVHHICMKPVLYGSWAARLARVPAVVNTFAGLGFYFQDNGWHTRLVRAGLTAGLRSAFTLPNSRALFENSADRERLIRAKVVSRKHTVMISGTGVDTRKFRPVAERQGTLVVVLACRMLWLKGVGDFVQAAKLLKAWKVPARLVLVGMPDAGSPSSISEAQLVAWQEQGAVEWWRYREDMPEVLASAHIVVLPSYSEGLPKILLEAGACGRPVVATTIPGCVDVVRDGENGFLVPPKDPDVLAKAITVLLKNPILRMRMGKRGREIVVREFPVELVGNQTLAVYRELLQNSTPIRSRVSEHFDLPDIVAQ